MGQHWRYFLLFFASEFQYSHEYEKTYINKCSVFYAFYLMENTLQAVVEFYL